MIQGREPVLEEIIKMIEKIIQISGELDTKLTAIQNKVTYKTKIQNIGQNEFLQYELVNFCMLIHS